jgi:hypothetical protein
LPGPNVLYLLDVYGLMGVERIATKMQNDKPATKRKQAHKISFSPEQAFKAA